MTAKPLAVALVSGGLDSITLAYYLHRRGHALHLLSANYGQRHLKEIVAAQTAADTLGASWDVLDLSGVGKLLGGSSLTSHDLAVPDGHYAEETMRITVVPNRNAILLACAYGVAGSLGASIIATAVHSGDHFIYPDCRPEFIEAFDDMERLAMREGMHDAPHLVTPFLHRSKADIVRIGASLGVPFGMTWSCYKGGANHCGRCGTCVERREAFWRAGVPDPTFYEDADYAIAHFTPDERTETPV